MFLSFVTVFFAAIFLVFSILLFVEFEFAILDLSHTFMFLLAPNFIFRTVAAFSFNFILVMRTEMTFLILAFMGVRKMRGALGMALIFAFIFALSARVALQVIEVVFFALKAFSLPEGTLRGTSMAFSTIFILISFTSITLVVVPEPSFLTLVAFVIIVVASLNAFIAFAIVFELSLNGALIAFSIVIELSFRAFITTSIIKELIYFAFIAFSFKLDLSFWT